jgi:spore coat polysaccharide biosynthesis predicted glycosyltransferase SpsG
MLTLHEDLWFSPFNGCKHTLNPVRYVVRADASNLEGSGHVMRSSAIAKELIDRGLEVVFVGKTTELGWLAKRIKSLGFSAIYESESLFQSNPKIDVLILDTYVVPLSNKFIAKHNWAKVITVVDELTPEFAADLRIHPRINIPSNNKTLNL